MEIESVEDLQNSDLEDRLREHECVVSTNPVFTSNKSGMEISFEKGPTYGDLLQDLDHFGFETDNKKEVDESENMKTIFVPW